MRGEKKIVNMMQFIKRNNFRDNGKRRIVYDNAAAIIYMLIVTARVKGAYDAAPLPVVMMYHIGFNRLVYLWRRITIIRGFLGLELINKKFI